MFSDDITVAVDIFFAFFFGFRRKNYNNCIIAEGPNGSDRSPNMSVWMTGDDNM
jgi:hypothetical protein